MPKTSALSAAACIVSVVLSACSPPQQKTNAREELGELFRNWPWVVLLVTSVFSNAFAALRSGSTIFYFKYVQGYDSTPVFWTLDRTTGTATPSMDLTALFPTCSDFQAVACVNNPQVIPTTPTQIAQTALSGSIGDTGQRRQGDGRQDGDRESTAEALHDQVLGTWSRPLDEPLNIGRIDAGQGRRISPM